jgi:hypothetical protein
MAASKNRGTWFLSAVVLACIVVSCSPENRSGALSSRAALSTTNGLAQNGLTTNGLIENGFWQNGFWQNGFWQNGFWQNGFWQNGFWQNGFWQNGSWQNGFWQNGFWQNGFWQNGLPADTLRNNSYARQLLQYIYSCAMPAGTYDTSLDPNQAAPLSCSTDADCDVAYKCTGGKCVIPLQGGGANGSGLAVNADGTTWWGSGKCDETCQRWVSACVLARTNAYGVHVQISMRAPSDAPQAVKDALAVSTTERSTFTLREGAYYGNIFATTPDGTAPPTSYTGPAAGAIVSTPAYYACAGPGSNIPDITKRFCSSQGDQVVIKVPGICRTNSVESGVCAGEDTTPSSPTYGAIGDCSTSLTTPNAQYNQVITVFLGQQPITVCGNGVCEAGESTTCLSDCHPGTWTKNYDPTFETLETGTAPLYTTFPDYTEFAMSAIAPDNTVVVVGDTSQPVNLDGVILPPTNGGGSLVKYNPDGSYAWPGRGVRFNNGIATPPSTVNASGVAVAPDGTIAVVGVVSSTLWWSTFSPSGVQLATHSLPFGAGVTSLFPMRTIAIDSQDNVLIATHFEGTATFPTSPNPTVLTGSYNTGTEIFLMKVSPQGSVLWARAITGNLYIGSLVADTHNNILYTAWQSSPVPGPTLLKLCAQDPSASSCADGSTSWSKSFGGLGAFMTAVSDAAGNVYAGGFFSNNTNFGGGPRPTTGYPPFLVKYDKNGVYNWDLHAQVICAPGNCQFGSYVYPTNLSFDTQGNVVMATWGSPSVGGGIDFGFGTFPTYSATNVFLSTYSPAGALKWAKQVPGVLGINVRGIALDSQGRVLVSGSYGGSMQVDDVMLETGLPEEPNVVSFFLASFGGPPPSDTAAPVIGATVDPSGASVQTVPRNIYVQATSAAGANVFFMPPTAIDAGNAGTSVVCWPPPNTTFPIGPTTVTCKASDPRGNQTSASFTITVADKTGPIFTPVPDVTVHASSSAGATVSYTPPTATDQISGSATVSCTPPSGTLFALGPHTVTCSATDASNNLGQMTFTVNVTSPVPAAGPGWLAALALALVVAAAVALAARRRGAEA